MVLAYVTVGWRCGWCGKPHDERDPPCESCGYNSFVDADGDGPETVDTGPEIVWACPNCGREHVRNSPPCARCGNPSLEKATRQYDDLERDLDVPSWLEVAKPYAPVIVVFVVVVALFATGIVPLSVLPGIGGDVPGEGTEANGIDLDAAALAVHDELEATRDAEGGESRRVDSELTALATAENHRFVRGAYGDEEPPPTDPSEFDLPCTETPAVVPVTLPSIDAYDDEGELAAAVATALLEAVPGDELRSGYEYEGTDLHVGPDGTVYALYAMC